MKQSLWTSVLVLFISTNMAGAAIYSGSLTYTPGPLPDVNDQLMVGPPNLQWATYTVSMSWTVTNEDNTYPAYPWKYTYTFGHNGGQSGISHIIIEGSEGLSVGDITGLSGANLYSSNPIDTHRITSGNPNMPQDIYGIKFVPFSDPGPFSMTWSFYSNRQPVWGDFYARCGGKQGGINYAYNYNMDSLGVKRGFTSADTDPAAPASNGSVDFHILRPDTYVPEPGTLGLLASAVAIWLVRRKK